MSFLVIVAAIILAVYFYVLYINRSAENKRQENEEKTASQEDSEPIDMFEETQKLVIRIQTIIQAEIVGDQKTIDAIKSETYYGPWPERRGDGGWLSIYDDLRILSIAGINHCKGISQYVGRLEVALVPEPDNEFDHDAIKVVAEDRQHLGYIPSNHTDFVRSLAKDTFPYRCTAFIEQHEDEYDGHKFFTGFV